MTRTTCSVALFIAVLPLACASAPRKAPPSASPSQPPLPRSSIAAVLQHRSDLQLSDEQVRRLQDLDDQLDRENSALRQEADKRKTKSQSSGGPFRGGMGGRSRGGTGSRQTGGPRAPLADPNRPKSAAERIDENDTNAYLAAENVLTETQRPQAQEIASRFRQERWDRRHATGSPSNE